MKYEKNENRRPKTKDQRPIFAKKSFGQNFLVDGNYIDKIVAALNPQKDETIIEIGAGRGALTEKLIESGANVIAIELDRDLIPILKEKFGGCENFRLVESDALKIDFKELLAAHRLPPAAKMVANLPYYISTAILQKLVEQRAVFLEMILMFQREVVERITAEPGNRMRGFLTVLVEAYLKTEKLFDVPPNAFRPAPKVWSAVMRLITKEIIIDETEIEIKNENLFREIVSAGFAQKRKTILNNLKNAPPVLSERFDNAETLLRNCGIDSRRRAETLTINEWKAIYKILLQFR